MKLIQTLITILFLAANLAVASESWKVESLGSFEIDLNIPEMGGLSALTITRFGKNFITLSDRGKYFQGTIDRNSSGLIRNIGCFCTICSAPILSAYSATLAVHQLYSLDCFPVYT